MQQTHFDIVIVGASFAGLSFARNLPSDSLLKILIIDAKKEPGFTVESTGLITEHTRQLFSTFFDIDKFITNKITTIGVVTTDFQEHFFSKQETPWIYQTDTKKLIQALATNLPPNVQIWSEMVFIGNEEPDKETKEITVNLLHQNKKLQITTRFLIGADGGSSKVALANKLDRNKKFLFGIEEVYFGNIHLGYAPDETIYHFWFGNFSLGYGGWLSATLINGKSAFRIGLAKKLNKKEDSKILLQKFISIIQEKNIITINNQADLSYGVYGSKIPIGGPLKKIYNNNTLLIGDAAGYCGAFSADGIKGAIISGIEAAKLVSDFFQNGQADEKVFSKMHLSMNKHHNVITYYKKQLFYRLVWDLMKSNRTFEQMYKIIKKEKEGFLSQFCDSKEKGNGLISIVLKPHSIPDLCLYGIYLMLDLFKK
jgi:digeranylgeranylglycerophospholipid reductase